MRELLSWSVSLGRLGGVQVRLHVFFLLFAVLALHLALRGGEQNLAWYAALGLATLLLSVLIHELAHVAMARRVGGQVDRIFLWPLGGLTDVHATFNPRNEWLIGIAGPAANLGICALLTPFLLALGVSLRGLLNPLNPPSGIEGATPALVLALAFWVNWCLTVVNLLPAYTLDGGRILRALLWPRYGYKQAVVAVTRVAQVLAVMLCILGFLVSGTYTFAWVPLTLLGIFLFFSARRELDKIQQERPAEGFMGYDFSQGYTSLEKGEEQTPPPAAGPLRSWMENRRQAKLARQAALEAEEDRRVDDILQRLHTDGLGALSAEEQALLKRASARYRQRTGE